jgi:predicted PurR-regulated permease PerM
MVRGLFIVAVLAVLKAAQTLLVPIAIAVVLAFVLVPPLRQLRRAGVPQGLAAALLVATLLSGMVLLGSLLADPAAQWWERAPATLSRAVAQIDRLRAAVPLLAPPPMPGRSAPRAAAQQPPADPVKDKLASEGITITRVLLGRVLTFGLSAAATVILLFFLLASEHWLLRRAVETLPNWRARVHLLAGVRSAQREIGRYLGAQACINAGVGVVTALAMMAIGLPGALLWGSLAAGLNFVPYIGPLVTGCLLLLAGIASFDTVGMMLAPTGAFIAIHTIESNFVSPWLVGLRLQLSAIWVFVSVLVWGWLWGIAGALLAVPILLGVRSVCQRRPRLRRVCVFLRGNHSVVPSLRELMRRSRAD